MDGALCPSTPPPKRRSVKLTFYIGCRVLQVCSCTQARNQLVRFDLSIPRLRTPQHQPKHDPEKNAPNVVVPLPFHFARGRLRDRTRAGTIPSCFRCIVRNQMKSYSRRIHRTADRSRVDHLIFAFGSGVTKLPGFRAPGTVLYYTGHRFGPRGLAGIFSCTSTRVHTSIVDRKRGRTGERGEINRALWAERCRQLEPSARGHGQKRDRAAEPLNAAACTLIRTAFLASTLLSGEAHSHRGRGTSEVEWSVLPNTRVRYSSQPVPQSCWILKQRAKAVVVVVERRQGVERRQEWSKSRQGRKGRKGRQRWATKQSAGA